jgi:SAM-dependent methyltransferase
VTVAGPGFEVLRDQGQIASAHDELLRRGLVPPDRRKRSALAEALVIRLAPTQASNLRPDSRKSWDVLRSVDAITARTSPDDPVLDMGSVGCAILPALRRLGYRQLAGIDLNPQVRHMAFAGEIDYRVGDMTATEWPDGHFAAATAISVIEHGVGDDALLAEVARLLRPGGIFCFSTDFWPEKIDTSDRPLFGLPWRIFSTEEIEALLERARAHGLEPAGELQGPAGAAGSRPIHFAGRDYTFLFGALVRAG